jgi:hypothetical protein
MYDGHTSTAGEQLLWYIRTSCIIICVERLWSCVWLDECTISISTPVLIESDDWYV